MARKICVVVTARPSYARIRTALDAIKAHPDLELQLVVAASALLDRYGSAVEVIARDGFHIDRQVYMIVEGENLVTSAKSAGIGLMELATVLDGLKPDAVVTIADRFETMATAVAAAYMNIPLVHVQGGEVTGSIDDKVRHAITKLADLHLVASHKAAERVIRMGEAPECVFVTGCPSIDLAKQAIEAPGIEHNSSAFGGVGAHIDLGGDFLIVLQHPVTTEYLDSRRNVEETLHAVAGLGMPTLWFWPNVDAGSDGTSEGIRAFRERRQLPHVHFVKNIPPEDFLRLAHRSRCVVGNSSVAIRECAWLGVPAVNIGTRQLCRDRGANVVDTDYDRAAIAQAIQAQVARGHVASDPLYGDGAAGERIADILATAPLSIGKRLTY
jgi:UDP-hydrolysing UDP-N-acetyl-D-glucosamine 2-epimerase